MPSRIASLAILIYWSIAAFLLLTWDVLPELTTGYAPDLRAIALAGDSSQPVRWRIQIMDDPQHPDTRRTVGESVTASSRRGDGSFELTSHVDLDAGGLLKGIPFGARSSEHLAVESRYVVDNYGNLNSFLLSVTAESAGERLKVTGQRKGRKMEIVSRGPLPNLNHNLSIDYEPRSVVGDMLGPMDRLPGLHVGQKWESKMMNPISAAFNPISSQVESVRVEVVRRGLIHWDGNPVTTFEVVHRTSPPMRTWVRTDGVILRQEIPFPFVRLVLERLGENDASLPTSPKPGTAAK
jgi:hypothetical protein